jgi:hypothetical protein
MSLKYNRIERDDTTTSNYVQTAVAITTVAATSLSVSNITASGNLTVSTGNITGGGIMLGDDGDIVDLNDGYCGMRFSNGVRVYSGNRTGTVAITLGANGIMTGRATAAQYADLAENYVGDASIEPGTVVCFGGANEVTTCDADACSSVAGVVSTNPAYLMNAELVAEFVVAVAFTGRVPCKVTGTVAKGDLMVAAGNGRARAEANPKVGTVIGKALQASEGDAVIEVVVGR